MTDDIEAKLVEYQRAARVDKDVYEKQVLLSGLLQDARDASMKARDDLRKAESDLLKSAWPQPLPL